MSNNDVSITLLFSLSWLVLMSFYQPRWIILGSMLILVCFVIVSLQIYTRPFIYIRTTSFCLGGTLASLFADSRERSVRLLTTTVRIVETLPAFVIAADSNGTIIAASDEAAKTIKDHYNPLTGHHFSDVFMGMYSPGEAVRIYYEWFQGRRSLDEFFIIRRQKHLKFRGRLIINGYGADRILTAIFTLQSVINSDEKNAG